MIAAGLIEYILMIGIPFYGIAIALWIIAWKMPRARKKKNNLDKLPPEGSQGGHY